MIEENLIKPKAKIGLLNIFRIACQISGELI